MPRLQSQQDQDLTFFPSEGQLAVDVIENEREIIIRTAIAGVRPEDIDVSLSHDIVTIRGKREAQSLSLNSTYHFRECFWGSFSRSVVLPASIRPEDGEAVFKDGVLTLTLPKTETEARIPIRIATDL